VTRHHRARIETASRNLRSARCVGGPHHGERRLLAAGETSLVVPGWTTFRYELRETTRGEAVLEWSFVHQPSEDEGRR